MRVRRVHLVLLASAATLVGTRVQAGPQRNASFNVEVTAYCNVGETASGAYTRRGIAAADPRVLPLGSRIRVQGLGRYDGTYDVEDTGREVKGREIDIFIRDCGQARKFGRQRARVRVLRVGTGERIDARL